MIRTALIVAQRPSDFVEMRRCAVALHARGWRIVLAYHCIYLDQANEQGIIDEIDDLIATGVIAERMIFATIQYKVKQPNSHKGGSTKRRGRLRRALWLVRHWLLKWPRAIKRVVPLYLFYITTYLKRQRAYEALMRSVQPDAMILPEDVVGLVTPLIIKAGQRNGVPSLILPYTIANQQEAFQSLKGQRNYRMRHWANYPCGLLWPRWVMRQDGHAVIRLPAPHVIAHALTRTSPPDPWMMNSGFANAIAVENEAMFDYYRKAGIPAGKMHVVGAIYDDYLAQFLLDKPSALAKLRAELGLDSGKPLLVVGGCPDQTGNCPAGFEFAGMAEFSERLAAALAPLKDAYQIVFRPHPNYREMGVAMEAAGIAATQIDTARLVALSDLYIAFGSATIRWAIACAVPTVNYDVFHYDYDDFKQVDGVVNVNEYEAFAAELARLPPGSARLEALKAAIKGPSLRWGKLDGKSVDRIVALLDDLCALKPVPRTSA